MASIYIETYSDKSFVVRGDTKEYKESLKAMGGKWNSRLTDKKSGDFFGAWIFFSDKHAEVNNWLKKGCPQLAPKEQTSYSPTHSTSYSSNTSRLEAKIDNLTRLVTALCAANGIDVKPVATVQAANVTEADDVVIEEDDDTPAVPPRRLLSQSTSTVTPRRVIAKK